MADSRATLKAFFETGDIPTQAQFAALIDSLASLADTNLFDADNTHNADIILKNTKVAKAENGGGTLNLRTGADNNAFLTADSEAFLQGWLGVEPTVSSLGFGDFSSLLNNGAVVDVKANSVTIRAETAAGNTDIRIEILEDKIGFFTVAPVVRPTITGSRAGNAALASLLTGLNGLGLVIDNTTA